jgi:Histone-like transcription factor (CBF/NF-Y) and archaeal histone/HMG (high mobility group) box
MTIEKASCTSNANAVNNDVENSENVKPPDRDDNTLEKSEFLQVDELAESGSNTQEASQQSEEVLLVPSLLNPCIIEDKAKSSGISVETVKNHNVEASLKSEYNRIVHENSVDNEDISSRRPGKRARTAYFIFADERRAEIQKQVRLYFVWLRLSLVRNFLTSYSIVKLYCNKHPGESVATVARSLGQIWSNMTPEEKTNYQQKAADERERCLAEAKLSQTDAVAKGKALSNTPEIDDVTTLLYPAARIRKICKLDPEVRGLSKEALLLVTKAAEMFTSVFGGECVRVAQIQNRRKLLPDDVVQVCSVRDRYEFLREDIKDLTSTQQKQNESAADVTTKKKMAVAASNTKTITSFFASSKTK